MWQEKCMSAKSEILSDIVIFLDIIYIELRSTWTKITNDYSHYTNA